MVGYTGSRHRGVLSGAAPEHLPLLESWSLPGLPQGDFPAETTRAKLMAKGRLSTKQEIHTRQTSRAVSQDPGPAAVSLCMGDADKKKREWGWETHFCCFNFGFKGKMKILYH